MARIQQEAQAILTGPSAQGQHDARQSHHTRNSTYRVATASWAMVIGTP